MESGEAEIICGANTTAGKIYKGMTVGQIRVCVGGFLNIPPKAKALINGKNVGDDKKLKAGSSLEFIKPDGTKL